MKREAEALRTTVAELQAELGDEHAAELAIIRHCDEIEAALSHTIVWLECLARRPSRDRRLLELNNALFKIRAMRVGLQ
jgi:hypothetical protein